MTDHKSGIPEDILNIPQAEFERAEALDTLDEGFKTKPIGFYRDAMQRLRKSKVSVIAFWIIMMIILLALLVPEISGYTYTGQNVAQMNLPPKMPFFDSLGIADGTRLMTNRKKSSITDTNRFPAGSVLSIVREYEAKGVAVVDIMVDYYAYCGVPEDEYHWFGTDYLGRDVLTRLFRGVRISLAIAFLSVISNVIIGVIYGSVAGYYGGRTDMFLTHFAEVLDGLPYIVVTILFMIWLGAGMLSIILALTVTGWIGTARLIRAQFYRFKGREYVLAARTLGVPDKKLIFRHILPNTTGPLITRAMIAIPGAIFSEAFLAYIGLGIKPPEPSIGVLLSTGQSVLLQYPYQTLFPALLISLLMIAFNLFSNGLRDALDPTRRGRSEDMAIDQNDTVLSVEDLQVSFKAYGGMVRAVRGVSFHLKRGETIAIVGESGSGKSVSVKAVMGILASNATIDGGRIRYDGMDLTQIKEDQFHEIRGNRIGLIFQDPLSALNPIMKIGQQITEVLRLNKKMSAASAKEEALQLMHAVGIPEAARRYNQYPFQFSGGMRQRIVIAIALAGNPEILICDEPTTALDVTVQAKILELINKIKEERHLSVVFITHDLGVVANMADRVYVMYAGKIAETGTSEEIFFQPAHPYTWALLSSIPDLSTEGRLEAIPGTPPNMISPPAGDAFAARNPYALKIDFKREPPLFRLSDTHYAATWLLHPNAPKTEMPKALAARIHQMTGGGDRHV